MYNPCEFCIYSSEETDTNGHIYYQCGFEDSPDNHPNAECSNALFDEE